MSKKAQGRPLGRRTFLTQAGRALAVTAGSALLPGVLRRTLSPFGVAEAQAAPPPNLVFAGTDGWIHLPPSPAIPPFHPDSLAPAPFTTYVFGFRNVTGLTPDQLAQQKMRAQHVAPLFWVDEYTGANEFRLELTNLGLQMRPDLVDAHTLHWHGFRNQIPYYDGEPNGSLAVPIGRRFTYAYRPRDPGTYMFHCHVEDVEHVHMGMTGLLFVRPRQDGQERAFAGRTFTRFAYNDGDGSTGYDREFALLLTEVWAESHWADAHIQLPEWSDYRADFSLLNGRVYPDTLAPNGPVDPFHPGRVRDPVTGVLDETAGRDASGDLVPVAGHEHLQYQPLSALVRCNAGERVLLRIANLGFKRATMSLAGLKLRVVGKDATPLRGRDGTDLSYETDTLSLGAGESIDGIFTAPPHAGGGFDAYVLHNRAYGRWHDPAGAHGGQRTEIRVHAPGALGPQAFPNDWAAQL